MKFCKMQGCGNDFLIVDGMKSEPPTLRDDQLRYLCHRQFGPGADGVIVLSPGNLGDAKWDFYNSDGSSAEMCGNGARCAIRFLTDRHFPNGGELVLETRAGLIRGTKLPGGGAEVVLLPGPRNADSFDYAEKIIEVDRIPIEVFSIDTGVPHAVIEVKDLGVYPISRIGRSIGLHDAFLPHRTNVTFFQRVLGNRILSTTFERGIWHETFACGTGAAAAAIIFSERYLQPFPIEVAVPGGDLMIDMRPTTKALLLQGPAEYVAEVELDKLPITFNQPRLYSERRSREV